MNEYKFSEMHNAYLYNDSCVPIKEVFFLVYTDGATTLFLKHGSEETVRNHMDKRGDSIISAMGGALAVVNATRAWSLHDINRVINDHSMIERLVAEHINTVDTVIDRPNIRHTPITPECFIANAFAAAPSRNAFTLVELRGIRDRVQTETGIHVGWTRGAVVAVLDAYPDTFIKQGHGIRYVGGDRDETARVFTTTDASELREAIVTAIADINRTV